MRRFISTFSSAVAALLLMTGFAAALPYNLSTPSGLNPGDKFRFLFVTGGQIGSSSSDIETYNTFVQAQAGGATYIGNVVNWKAIGSTPSIAARDNVGGFGTLVPVYRPDGVRVANDLTTSNGGLWGAADADYGEPGTTPLLAAPGSYIDGSLTGLLDVLTGSERDGTKAPFNQELGSGGSSVQYGWADQINGRWLATGGLDYDVTAYMYGLSEELTVSGGPSGVPEIDPAGMGSVLALVTGALGLLERRRSRR